MNYKLNLLKSYINCLNIVRISNYFILKSSHFISKFSRINILSGKIFAVSFETVLGCNLECIGCELGLGMINRKSGLMDINFYNEALCKLPKTVFHINLHFQGEPLLHPKIAQFISLARDKKIFVSLSTNGILLTQLLSKELIDAKLSHIIFSIDGFNQESYEKYRKKGKFETVITNIKQLVELKKQKKTNYPLIEVQTVLLSHNESQIHKIKEMVLKMGVNKFTTKTAYVPRLDSNPDYLPKNRNYLRYKILSSGKLIPKKGAPRFCFRTQSSIVILQNMDVVPCCFIKNGEIILGNINKMSLNEIIKSKKSKKLQRSLLKSNPPPNCKNCI